MSQLIGHTGPGRSAGFSPDGRRIVTAGLDGQVNLYAFDIGGGMPQLLVLARERVARQLTDGIDRRNFAFFARVGRQHVALIQPQALIQNAQLAGFFIERRDRARITND